MQNAGPDSPCLRRPALAGLALAMLVAASDAAADEDRFRLAPSGVSPRLADARADAAHVRPGWRFWPMAVELRLRGAEGGHEPATLGFAYRLPNGVSVGAGGGVAPGGGGFVGIVSLDIRF